MEFALSFLYSLKHKEKITERDRSKEILTKEIKLIMAKKRQV